MLEFEQYLSCRSHPPVADSGDDLDPWVSYMFMIVIHFNAKRCFSGGNCGSGSHWLYDGGALVQSSVQLGKPIILVTIK